MFQSHNLSLRLSEVLSDIGVNERIVMRRRRAYFLLETMKNLQVLLLPIHVTHDFTVCNFGSQTEASTTKELMSDLDTLICLNKISVIQDWSEWKFGKNQLLMVQDETTSPGYCLIQLVRPDMCLPDQDAKHRHYTTDNRGRVLMKNSSMFQNMANGSIRHGPALLSKIPPARDQDLVLALHCSSWPKEAESWLQQHNVSGWPTAEMKRYAVEHGCFVVPVASRSGVNEDTEWRISTSHAERCLMLSLNMTQMRCYILMKMMIKTYLKSKCEDTISSFMCKNVLFHCIAETRASEWNDSNLLPCFNQCLQYLLHCILTENCPHFIIPGNNLLAGKLSFQTKQQVVEIMKRLTNNIELSLLGISIDQLGYRLLIKSGRKLPNLVPYSEWFSCHVMATHVIRLSGTSMICMMSILETISHNNFALIHQNMIQNVYKLCCIYSTGSRLEQVACCYIVKPLCSIIGSIIASVNIQHSQPVSPAALQWFSAGLNSDFSSSRLKLASALYCAGQYEQCEAILLNRNRKLEQRTVLAMCFCTEQEFIYSGEFHRRTFREKSEEKVIQQNIALCAHFLSCEANCVPKELRYEMFRSTEEDLPYRSLKESWMDWAVVDSIPFLHFLQYKVYSKLHRPAQQQLALLDLARTIDNEPNLCHKETALNLLGQCMKEENRKDEALCCYMMSIKVRPRNNAAKWLICILLADLINHRF